MKQVTITCTPRQADVLVSLLDEFISDQQVYLESPMLDGEDSRIQKCIRQANWWATKITVAKQGAK